MLDSERNAGSGNVVIGKRDRNFTTRDSLRHHFRRATRGKAGVVSDDNAFAGFQAVCLGLLGERSHRSRDAANILEGEIVSDDAAPTVGTELDLLSHAG